ncbi:hypothetical protein DFH09DRAFT_951944 [Mycena vulgaris]|nr:hypothetical protein DFH09DRAFT_951944 [Mycena vulgaris]
MGRETVHSQVTSSYLKHMFLRDLLAPSFDDDEDEDEDGDDAEAELLAKTAQLKLDMAILAAIKSTRYLRGRPAVSKSGNLSLAWVYAGNPEDHGRFQGMLRVSPMVFAVILELIQDHMIFTNNSNVPQTPVDVQL